MLGKARDEGRACGEQEPKRRVYTRIPREGREEWPQAPQGQMALRAVMWKCMRVGRMAVEEVREVRCSWEALAAAPNQTASIQSMRQCAHCGLWSTVARERMVLPFVSNSVVSEDKRSKLPLFFSD